MVFSFFVLPVGVALGRKTGPCRFFLMFKRLFD